MSLSALGGNNWIASACQRQVLCRLLRWREIGCSMWRESRKGNWKNRFWYTNIAKLLAKKIAYGVVDLGHHWFRQEFVVDSPTTHTVICHPHYSDVIMSMMVSQITSVSFVYSTVCSGADQWKHQSSASLALVREFAADWWIPHTKGQ